jgi:HK97 family phage portal protein
VPAAGISATVSDSRPWGLTSYLDTAGAWVDEASVLGTSDVWACVRLVSSTIAGRTWSEWRGATRLERPSRLVRRPMGAITRRAWVARVISTLMLYQKCYLWMVGGVDAEGVPGSLLPVPPGAIVPEGILDPWGIVPPARYRIGGAPVSAEELVILELVPLPTPDQWLGSAITRARAMYGSVLASSNYARSWWAEAGTPGVVITTDQELTDPQADALRDRWVARRAGGFRVPAVMGKGAQARPFGADPTTESAVEARREITAEVARYFGIPPYLVNAPLAGGSSLTYTTTESQALDLIRYCLRGYSDPVEDAISDLLPGDYLEGRRAAIQYDDLTAGELTGRIAAYHMATGAPFMTGPEARVAFSLNPDAAMAGSEPLPWDKPAPAPPPAPADDQAPADQEPAEPAEELDAATV